MKKGVLRRLGRFLRPYARLLIRAALLAAAAGGLALLVPLLAGWAVGAAGTEAGQADLPAAARCCGGALAAALAAAVFSYGASSTLIRVGQAVSYDLRKAAFQRIVELPVPYFDTHPAGDLISRVCYDVDTVNAALSTDLLQIGTSLLTVAGSFGMLLFLSPALSGVFFVTLPLTVLLTRFQMRRIRPLFRQRSRELGELNGFVEERVGCRRAIGVYGVEDADLKQFDRRNDQASETYYQADRASTALGPSVNFINNLSLAAISVFGALLYLSGGLSLAALSSFVLYSRKFSGPIREAADLLGDLQASVTAAERILDLLDEPPEPGDPPGAREPGRLTGAISFRHVKFGYDPDRPVLRDLNVDIPAGSTVAVVGPTGAGKTTLVSLLLRFYTPQAGAVTIDGIPLERYARDGLRRRMAIVLQDSWLWGGTVAENIAYGLPRATRQQIEDAAKAACVHPFLAALPNGYDTVLADGGGGLSKGQRQLLVLARCFLADADIVILDEATSDVDPETEARISEALARLRQGRTCFLIAHRLATVRFADRILVLQDGAVAEQGTHEELLAKNGVYRALHDAQFS